MWKWGETIIAMDPSGKSIIRNASSNLYQEVMALEYSSSEIEVGFVKHLESLLTNNRNPYMPAIKGLYYPKKAQYPWLIFEKYELMESQITQRLEEVNQLSILFDIASCIKNWKAVNKLAKISVAQNTIFIGKEGDTWTAKVCPLYGYNYKMDYSQGEPSQNLAVSLPLKELSWMRDITKFLNKDHNLSEDHLFKKMLDKKWLSKEDRFRPSSYKTLCEDLQNLLGK